MTNETTHRVRASWFTTVGAVLAAGALLWPQGASAQESSRVAEGAELYGQTCGRCHNPRPSTERRDREWRTVMGHMRARANLSRSDARAILAFLQATNGSSGQASAGSTSDRGSRAESDAGDISPLPPGFTHAESDALLLRMAMPRLWWRGDSLPEEPATPVDQPGER